MSGSDYICELLPAMMMLDENESKKKKKKQEEEDSMLRKVLGVKPSTMIVKKRWNKKTADVRRNLRAADLSEDKKKEMELKEDEEGREYLGVSVVALDEDYEDGDCYFSAEITDPTGRLVCLGTSFITRKKAAIAYDKAALDFYGLEAKLNFPHRVCRHRLPESS